jgi:hypothetical protein
MNDNSLDKQIRNRLRAVAIIWAAIFISVFFFLLVTLALPQPASNRPNYVIAALLGIMTLGACALAVIFRRRAVEAIQNKGDLIAMQQGYVVSFAMAEAPALLGLVSYFASGINSIHYLFFLLSFIVLIICRPRPGLLETPRPSTFGS